MRFRRVFAFLVCFFLVPSVCFAVFGNKNVKKARELFRQKRYIELMRFAEDVYGRDRKAWESIIFKFVRKTPEDDLKILRKKCADGNGYACTYVAFTTKKHSVYRVEFLDKGCGLGDGFACMLMGLNYLNGMGVNRRPNKAVAYFQKACDQNVPCAFFFMAAVYKYGIKGVVKKDKKLAKKYYKKACDLGCKAACNEIAPLWKKTLKGIGKAFLP